MAQRHLTANSHEQLVASRVALSIGIGILALIAFMWSQDPDASLAKAAPFGLVGLALLVGARIHAARNSQYLKVDVSTRQAAFVARGKERWKASIDELAPIVCTTFERRHKRNGRLHELTEYQAGVTDVREVVSVGDILILGNDRHIALPSDFCRPRDVGAVVRAIHQLIAERAAASGNATSAA